MSGLGDPEDGDEPVGCGDGDPRDEGLDEGFALVRAAGVDDVGEVVGDLGEGDGVGCGRLVVEGGGEFVEAWGVAVVGAVAGAGEAGVGAVGAGAGAAGGAGAEWLCRIGGSAAGR